ncbi:aminoacylase-1-like [Battus philenor]|uniref:aminoacylase-1-like n=1 Tax=Battus philenor TaxID=42288 RepID=UPI0035CEBD16
MKSLLFYVCLVLIHDTEANDECFDPAVQLLQQYVQINTTSGSDQTQAIRFWYKLAEKQNATFSTYNYTKDYPIVTIRWKGKDPSLSSIILVSHIDVVPVADESKWKYPPFSGIIKDDYLYGRGTQDCKSVSIQYYEAMKQLSQQKIKLQRDVILVLFTDHEQGVTFDGIRCLIENEKYSSVPIGGGIDEGVSYTSNNLLLFYQDKALLVLDVECYGIETHGSLMPDSNKTAIGQCAKVINSLQEYRDEQVEYMKKLAINDTSSFTSINLNRLEGSLIDNVLPGRVTLRYYINPSVTSTPVEVFDEIQERIDKIGGNIELTVVRSVEKSPAVVTDKKNPFYEAISDAAKTTKFSFDTTVTFDQTNAGGFRKFGIPVLGFSPLPRTKFLVHGINENIEISKFLNGIPLYKKSIQNLANLSKKQVSQDSSIYLDGYDDKVNKCKKCPK